MILGGRKLKNKIILKSHKQIHSSETLEINQKRYVLYNGKIHLVKILSFNDYSVNVEFVDGFKIKTIIEAIYKEIPNETQGN